MASTKFAPVRDFYQEPTSHQIPSQSHFIGVRGFIVLQSFLWSFLTVIAPTTVTGTPNSDGPVYQEILRKVFSVLFWNESLIYSTFILLSARTICTPFLNNPSHDFVASSSFRRGLRLWFPSAVSLAIVYIIFTCIGTSYIDDFKTATNNTTIKTPYMLPNALAYFNSVFTLFWTNKKFDAQAASYAYPSQTLWVVSVLFQQSYTVYMTMVIIPYVRKSWRVKAFIGFIITAWWVDSWAWYSITGLLLADVSINMDFQTRARAGISLGTWRGRNLRLPVWPLYSIITLAGVIMMYLWAAWRPQDVYKEVRIHTGEYSTGGLNDVVLEAGSPMARDDNYLFLLGTFLFLETWSWLQALFRNPVLMYLGKRSFSWFLVQNIIVYTVGIKLFAHLTETRNASFEAAATGCFFVCLVTVIPSAEIFYRLIDFPSQAFARVTFDWIKK
ncbi:3bed0e88-8054-45c9-a6e9-f2044d4c8bd1 [Sclerotinia trifoliorum]|uniref:3bed0e88-8054-45c9-a6e9-f2044d4c8bd1 n=1 Tax=Sclerotinia trifoliorum TaxID=28548 RepID=A0A8H2ZPT0_9HELO|nr:3bed0e88-8054-45c9-a6e9-f2044d4c8bd1 [Sclerotinia trifoliorum]